LERGMNPSGAGQPVPRLEINLEALVHNTAVLRTLMLRAGLDLVAVTKVFRGDPRVARAFVEGGAAALADSRLSNLARLQSLRARQALGRDRINRGGGVPLILLREPNPGEVELALSLSDGVLCGSPEIAETLARTAGSGRSFPVLLVVDQGDLREGFLPEQLPRAAVDVERRLQAAAGERDWRRRVHVAGLAANMACFCGAIPTLADLDELVLLARDLSHRLERPLRVSAGNTAVLPLLARGHSLPPGLDDLRVGEGIALGVDSLWRCPLPDCRQDTVTFHAAVLEVRSKPSAPSREVAEDAFGHRPVFSNRGRRLRAILQAGRQDIAPEGLNPLDDGIQVIGASGDHLVLDVEDCPRKPQVGSEVTFAVSYACLLQAMTSPDVAKVYVGERGSEVS